MEPRLSPALRGFSCLRCDEGFPIDDYHEGCPTCAAVGHPSSLVATYAPETPARERLPLLGEPDLAQGDTPLLPLPSIAEELAMDGVWIKAEGRNPTGSHKDRMAALVVARARMSGFSRVVAASSGNAGVALAAFAGRAGIGCTIWTKKGLTGTWERDMLELGADLEVVATGPERWERVAEVVRAGEGYPATNYCTPPVGSNPFGVQGYKSIGHELAADLAASPPDAVLVPTARGDLLWGIWEGLRETGVEPLPKMIAVEPFVRTERILEGGEDYRTSFPGTTDQAAIAGPTVTWQTVSTLRASGGLAIDVGDAAAHAAQVELVRQGIPLERCSAAPLAALRRLRATGTLPQGSRAVLLGSADGRREDPFEPIGVST